MNKYKKWAAYLLVALMSVAVFPAEALATTRLVSTTFNSTSREVSIQTGRNRQGQTRYTQGRLSNHQYRLNLNNRCPSGLVQFALFETRRTTSQPWTAWFNARGNAGLAVNFRAFVRVTNTNTNIWGTLCLRTRN